MLTLHIRLPAEWEKQKSTMIVFPTNQKDWQHSIRKIQKSYVELIKVLRKFQTCIVICGDKKELERCFDSLENLKIYEIQTNDTWIRDFGAIDVFIGNKLKSYNFKFNAWGDKFTSSLDDRFNSTFFKDTLLHVDFVLEGGSIDTNGEGVMLSTQKCIFNKNRNPTYSKKEIKSKLKTLFGLKKLIILKHGTLKGDDTDSHVDMLARFINRDTIAYAKCYDKKDIHFEELKKMEKELQKTGFTLVPLPLPKTKQFNNKRLPASYVNFIFINGALIVPKYNDKNDKTALDTLKKHIKNRVIKSVDASVFIREYGSLHCASINQFEERK